LALSYAPSDADRATVVESIGRGIGRVAAHEFAHQILPGADLHASGGPGNYEYASADRPALFHGRLAWGLAGPLLASRLGTDDQGQITSAVGRRP
jgi:hypothetical protein